MEENMEKRYDVTKSVLKLMRAMRRRPMHEMEFPPAVGRTLMTLREHDGVRSWTCAPPRCPSCWVAWSKTP